ncbi:Sigma 54 modulation protein / S30EA ribosomal protein [Phycisphaerae bacterium RAS1]|nr:Sigma 54 modulation protein / S30EA ribosomal protein [Phycisphaerae bacterium RAS1]
MDITVHNHDVHLTPELRTHIDERLAHALDRFDSHIHSLHVKLRDLNGPKGGEDMQCQIAVKLHHPSGDVHIDERGDDAFAVVSRAADRTATAVSRELGKHKRGVGGG